MIQSEQGTLTTDQYRTPSWIVSRCQSILTQEWRQRLPLLQSTSPADLAADIIAQVIEQMDTISLSNAPLHKPKSQEKSGNNVIVPAATATSSTNISIIDFCSGAGGPTPTIESIINGKRLRNDEEPIPFVLSDLRPHLNAWKQASLESEHVSYIAEPVDAADPPTAAVSSHWSPSADVDSLDHDLHADEDVIAEFEAETAQKHKKKKTQIFRLFALSFHHFNDTQASAVLHSTLNTSHAFCILELQDRRLASFILTAAQFVMVVLMSGLWFWRDWFSLAGWLRMACTYVWPAVPFVMAFDGVISALRTREFEEVVRLIDAGMDGDSAQKASWTVSMMQSRREAIVSNDGVIWRLQAGRRLHTWPVGYANWITGVRFRS